MWRMVMYGSTLTFTVWKRKAWVKKTNETMKTEGASAINEIFWFPVLSDRPHLWIGCTKVIQVVLTPLIRWNDHRSNYYTRLRLKRLVIGSNLSDQFFNEWETNQNQSHPTRVIFPANNFLEILIGSLRFLLSLWLDGVITFLLHLKTSIRFYPFWTTTSMILLPTISAVLLQIDMNAIKVCVPPANGCDNRELYI